MPQMRAEREKIKEAIARIRSNWSYSALRSEGFYIYRNGFERVGSVDDLINWYATHEPLPNDKTEFTPPKNESGQYKWDPELETRLQNIEAKIAIIDAHLHKITSHQDLLMQTTLEISNVIHNNQKKSWLSIF